MIIKKILGVCLVIGLLEVPVASANVIVDASVSETSGVYSYSYEIENQTAVNLLGLSLTFTGDIVSIQSPNGWAEATGTPSPSETLVQWISSDVPYDVPAFGTLSGFIITSNSGPGSVSFSTLDDNFSEFNGQTTGPVTSSIPEPSICLLLAIGLLSFFGNDWRLGTRCLESRE